MYPSDQASRWGARGPFVVKRYQGHLLEPFTVATFDEALWWARELRRRYRESVWIERFDQRAHVTPPQVEEARRI